MDLLFIDTVAINGSVNWSVRKGTAACLSCYLYGLYTLIITQLDPWVDPNSHQLKQTGNNLGICLSSD